MSQEDAMRAIGMIETRGLVASVEAADAMVKAADVCLEPQQNVGGGIVMIRCRGDTAAVLAAVAAGSDAARRVGGFIGSHVIENPSPELI
jgi:Carbon dioxide concentrating mechanism/carboxysome shell protein